MAATPNLYFLNKIDLDRLHENMERYNSGAPFARRQGFTTTMLIDLIHNLYDDPGHSSFIVVGRSRDHLKHLIELFLELVVVHYQDKYIITTLQMSRGLIVTNRKQNIKFLTVDSLKSGSALRGMSIRGAWIDAEIDKHDEMMIKMCLIPQLVPR